MNYVHRGQTERGVDNVGAVVITVGYSACYYYTDQKNPKRCVLRFSSEEANSKMGCP